MFHRGSSCVRVCWLACSGTSADCRPILAPCRALAPLSHALPLLLSRATRRLGSFVWQVAMRPRLVTKCGGERPQVFGSVYLSFKLGMMLFGSVLAFRSRNIPSSLNESKFIGLSIYQFFVAMALTIPFISERAQMSANRQPVLSLMLICVLCFFGPPAVPRP